MEKNKKILILALLILVIGFATVSTTLFINGSVAIDTNKEEFENGVIFTDAKTNHGTATISEDGKTIVYVTDELKAIDDSSKLDFTIKNKSSQYDADTKIECTMVDDTNGYNDYVTVFPNENGYYIQSGASVDGYIDVKLIKNVIEEAQVSFVCKIKAQAVERVNPGVVFDKDAKEFQYTTNNELGCKDIQCAITKLNEMVEGGEVK